MGTQVDSAFLVTNEGVNSLVWAGYPVPDSGTAILNILTGQTSPVGRLPVTQYPVCSPVLGWTLLSILIQKIKANKE